MEIKKDVIVRQFQVVAFGNSEINYYMLDDQNRFWVSLDAGKTWSERPLPQVAL